jgi:hypothetical protein
MNPIHGIYYWIFVFCNLTVFCNLYLLGLQIAFKEKFKDDWLLEMLFLLLFGLWGLLCQPRVIVKMIVEKQMEYRLAGETEVLGENLPQRHICPSQNLTWPDPGLNPGRRGGKPATNRLSYGAAKCLLPPTLE